MSSNSAPNPSLLQFLESVPPPVTLLLVKLGPSISWLRRAAEVLSWKSHWTDPWLVLAGWWTLCLSTNAVLRYLLPLALLVPPFLPYLPWRRAEHPQPHPTTEHTISISLSDITILQSLIPTLPAPPAMSFRLSLRLSALLYIPYTIIVYFVPLPILVGGAGTLLLTYRAPWARTLRTVLWRSAYIRRFLLQLWSRLTGTTPPALAPFTTSNLQVPPAWAPASPPIRFLFTILECQRWWMGLDWTAALLPGERPSWCGVSQQPVPPPSAFNLPAPTSVYLPVHNGKKVRRTATWRWEEGEWGVWINKDGTGGKRVEKKPPGLEDEEGGARIASKAASMLKERTASMSSRSEMSPTKDDRESSPNTSIISGPERDSGVDIATDADGWVYGDNKWDGTGPKGGLGKYTRFRRWTRIALLEEKVEEIPPGDGDDSEVDPSVDLRQKEEAESISESPQTVRDPHKESHESGGGSGLGLRIKTTLQGDTKTK